MSEDSVKVETLENGLTVILEPINHVRSLAYNLFIPGGLVSDPEESQGASLILAELLGRGTSGKSSRELSDAFDAKGISHGEGAGEDTYSLSGSCLSDDWETALELLFEMLNSPLLPNSEIPAIKSVLKQDIDSLKDNPTRYAMHQFNKSFFPKPLNRSSKGSLEGIENTSSSLLKNLWEGHFKPKGAVLSIAGRLNNDLFIKKIKELSSKWQGVAPKRPTYEKFPNAFQQHISEDSAQVQIVLAYQSCNYKDPEYFSAHVLNEILSGGFSGRLFTEVREKRGLCYSVNASYSATPDYGRVLVYAGTTTDRAQETLDVTLNVINSLKGSILEEELNRAKANLLTSLVIGRESSRGRAGANIVSYWYSKEIRNLDYLKAQVTKVTLKDLENYIEKFPAKNISMLTLGAKELKLN